MRVFAIVMITTTGKNLINYGLEPVGIYSDIQTALDYVEELESRTSDKECIYDILEFGLDTKPLLLDFLEKQEEVKSETLSDKLIGLMKSGLIDQLVGEDGHFYYVLTELGEESATSKLIPEQIKKYFIRRKK